MLRRDHTFVSISTLRSLLFCYMRLHELKRCVIQRERKKKIHVPVLNVMIMVNPYTKAILAKT